MANNCARAINGKHFNLHLGRHHAAGKSSACWHTASPSAIPTALAIASACWLVLAWRMASCSAQSAPMAAAHSASCGRSMSGDRKSICPAASLLIFPEAAANAQLIHRDFAQCLRTAPTKSPISIRAISGRLYTRRMVSSLALPVQAAICR